MRSVPDTSDPSLPQGNVSGTPQSQKGAGHDGRLPSLRHGLVGPGSALEDDLSLLLAILGDDQPMTVRRAARATGLPPEHVSLALEMLCAAGMVLRLNTIVVSYVMRNS